MNSDTAISQQTPSLTVQASWLLIAKVVAFVFSIGAPVLIVRFLNPTEFGLYKQASLVILTAMQLLTAGFYMTLFYYLPRRPHQADKFVLNVVLLHFVVGLLGATTIPVGPSVLGRFADPSLERYAVLVAVTLLFTTVSYCLEVIATASQDVKYSAAF